MSTIKGAIILVKGKFKKFCLHISTSRSIICGTRVSQTVSNHLKIQMKVSFCQNFKNNNYYQQLIYEQVFHYFVFLILWFHHAQMPS